MTETRVARAALSVLVQAPARLTELLVAPAWLGWLSQARDGGAQRG